MGGDGGVVETQRKFMRGYKHPNEEAESKNVKKHQRLRSTICSVSSKPLVEPIAVCELGNLYNKEEILSHLINKTLNESFKHVRGLKDLKTSKFKLNPIYSNNNNSSSSMDSSSASASQFLCPVTGDEFNGALPLVCIWSTGYVLSERAIKELGIESLQSEYGPFNGTTDLVKISPMLPEDIQSMKANMEIRRLMYAQQKKESSSSSSSSMNKRKREKMAAEDGEVVLSDGTENMKIAASSDHRDGKLNKCMNSADQSMMMIQSPVHDTQSFVSGFTTQHTSSHHHQPPQPISSSSSSASTSLKSMSSAHHIVKNVLSKEIKRQSEQSQVYRGLFHKDHEADKKDRDLFMSVAGIRYTLS